MSKERISVVKKMTTDEMVQLTTLRNAEHAAALARIEFEGELKQKYIATISETFPDHRGGVTFTDDGHAVYRLYHRRGDEDDDANEG